jgi:hypothetical protein
MLFRKLLLLSKIDILADSCLARSIQEAHQSNTFANARATTNQYYEASMRNLPGSSQEIIPVASDKYVVVFGRETQNLFICCLWINQLPQLENLVAQSRKAIGRIIRHIVIEKEFHTGSHWFARSHLASHKHVNFAAMILIVGQALVNLRTRQVRETLRNQTINGFAVL